MDITRAVEILNAVAQGVNPFTGEVLPADCICNQVEMVRALYCVLNEVKPSLGKKRNLNQRMRGNHGRRKMMQSYCRCLIIIIHQII